MLKPVFAAKYNGLQSNLHEFLGLWHVVLGLFVPILEQAERSIDRFYPDPSSYLAVWLEETEEPRKRRTKWEHLTLMGYCQHEIGDEKSAELESHSLTSTQT